MGWLWFLGTLVPVIGLIQVGSQAFADRYTYIPSIGLFVAGIWIADELRKRLGVSLLLPAVLTCAVIFSYMATLVGQGSSILALANILAKVGTTPTSRKKNAPTRAITTVMGYCRADLMSLLT